MGINIGTAAQFMHPVEPGNYLVEVENMKETERGGERVLLLQLTIVDGGDWNGRSVFDSFQLDNPKAAPYLGRALGAFGVELGPDATELDPDEVIGARAFAQIDHRQGDDGQIYEDVKRYTAAS